MFGRINLVAVYWMPDKNFSRIGNDSFNTFQAFGVHAYTSYLFRRKNTAIAVSYDRFNMFTKIQLTVNFHY